MEFRHLIKSQHLVTNSLLAGLLKRVENLKKNTRGIGERLFFWEKSLLHQWYTLRL